MRKYTFYTQRAKGASRSYTKTEDKLDDREINLLFGNLINEFNKAPDKVKEKFMDNMLHYIMKSQVAQDGNTATNTTESSIVPNVGTSNDNSNLNETIDSRNTRRDGN